MEITLVVFACAELDDRMEKVFGSENPSAIIFVQVVFLLEFCVKSW